MAVLIPGSDDPPADVLHPFLANGKDVCLLSILFNNNLVDKSPGKEIRSNMPSISKWGNTVIDARQRESCSLGGYESP